MIELIMAPDMQTINHVTERSFQKMAIMDLALCNTDRNPRNLMIDPKTGEIGLIDHALILPAQFKSPGVFAWMLWDKANIPFSAESLREIADLDFERDSEKIRAKYPNYPKENLQTMRITYHLLKSASIRGLTPFQIGCFFTGHSNNFRQPPIHFLYEHAKEFEGDDPEKNYSRMIQCIDATLLKILSNPIAIDPELSMTAIKEAFENGLKAHIKSYFLYTEEN
jgi:hypothetical protein